MASRPSIILTRPQAQCQRTAALLAANGLKCLLSPMLVVEPLSLSCPESLDRVSAVVITSANALLDPALDKLLDLPCYCVGDVTADAARRRGFQIIESAGGDGHDLAKMIVERGPDRQVLYYPHGDIVRDEPKKSLTAHNLGLIERIVYRVRAAKSPSAELADHLQNSGQSIFLFYSPRSATICEEVLVGFDLGLCMAICLSPAVAGALCAQKWGKILVSRHKNERSLLDCLSRHLNWPIDTARGA